MEYNSNVALTMQIDDLFLKGLHNKDHCYPSQVALLTICYHLSLGCNETVMVIKQTH